MIVAISNKNVLKDIIITNKHVNCICFRPSSKRTKVNITTEAHSPHTSAYFPFVITDDEGNSDESSNNVDTTGKEPPTNENCHDKDYDPNKSFLEYGSVDAQEDIEFAETSRGEVRQVLIYQYSLSTHHTR